MNAFFLRLALATSIMVPVSSAMAADLEPPPPVDDLRPATYDWTGGYIGLIGTVISLDGHYDKVPDCVPGLPCGPVDPEMSGTGYMGGVIAGWNYQFDDFLVGIEGDYSWGGLVAQNRDPAERTEMYFDSMGTIRARGGVVLDNTLIYLTAGLAFIDARMTGEVGPLCCSFLDEDSQWVTGYVIGAGMEHAFSDSLHGRLEYLYIDAPGYKFRLEDPNNFGGDVHMHFTGIHAIRAGLTYNFSL